MLENVVTNNVENKVAECNTYASVLTPVEGYKIDSVKVTVFTFSGHIVFKERFIKYNKEWITLNELYKIL